VNLEIKIGERVTLVQLPDRLDSMNHFIAEVGGQSFRVRWDRQNAALFIQENPRAPKNEGQAESPPLVERCIRLRSGVVRAWPGEPETQVSLSHATSGRVMSANCTVTRHAPGQEARAKSQKAKGQVVRSQITGKVLKVSVKSGDAVAEGDLLLVIEAMKMENKIFATSSGTVAKVNAVEGSMVTLGDELLRLG
jgi:oxaloacetate decarboxylase alpha subunit